MTSATPIEHPSLVLGGVIDRSVLGLTSGLAANQSRIDAAHQKLNSYILMKRSLAMTLNELLDLGADVTTLVENLKGVDEAIKVAAGEYVSTCLSAEAAMQKQREELASASPSELIESPVDFSASVLQSLPLSADSMKLDAQYFSCVEESEQDVAADVERFVRDSMGGSGTRSNELARQASAQVTRQLQNNSLAGTLVIAANCSHREVAVFDPLVLDPEKAASAWNRLFPAEALPTSQPERMAAIAHASEQEPGNAMSLVSGVTYGSSFVGMAHLLKTTGVKAGVDEQTLEKIKSRVQLGGWLEQATGGLGIEDEILNDVKRLLSSQNVRAHVSVIVAGALPEIASNEVKLTVSKVVQPEAAQSLKLLKQASADPSDGAETVDSDANRSRALAQAVNLENARASNVIRTLNDVDRASNRALDVNSLMKAFESYVSAVRKSGSGVPTGFFVRNIGKQEVAKLWLKRYANGSGSRADSEQASESAKAKGKSGQARSQES
jgi:hypothetical protein